MAAISFAPNLPSGRRIPLAEIDAAVAARLGPTRGLGNSQPACFNRQVAMYLAKHIGNWSTKIIGRFYGGRDHSTVCYGIQRIRSLRETDPDVDTLLSDLCWHLREESAAPDAETPDSVSPPIRLTECDLQRIANAVAAQVCAQLEQRVLEHAKCSLADLAPR